MQSVRGVLLDIDGVLHVSMRPIVGAVETLRWLAQNSYPGWLFEFFLNITANLQRGRVY